MPSSWSKYTILFSIFFLARLLSFWLRFDALGQGIIATVLLVLLVAAYFKNPRWAWYLVLGELFLGGSGQLFQLGGLAARTLMLVIFLALWFFDQYRHGNLRTSLRLDKKLLWLGAAAGFFLLLEVAVAYFQGHGVRAIFQDVWPFAFLLLIFPARQFFETADGVAKARAILTRLVGVFMIGNAIFGLITWGLFVSGQTVLQSPFYKWFRDVLMGKITDLGTGFWRVVEPTHLLIVPLILIIVAWLMAQRKEGRAMPAESHGAESGAKMREWSKSSASRWWSWICLTAGLLILAMNLSRAYLLGLALGFLILLALYGWRSWWRPALLSAAIFMALFFGLNLAASGGRTIGLELFGLRLGSVVAPNSEESSATRMMILPELLKNIKAHPLLGVGFGSSVTYFNSFAQKDITTRNLDWGYLEMYLELGLLGCLTFLAAVVYLARELWRRAREKSRANKFDTVADTVATRQVLTAGLLAGLGALLVINITAGAFLHVYGMVFLAGAILVLNKNYACLGH